MTYRRIFSFLLLSSLACAQASNTAAARDAARKHYQNHPKEILTEFFELLRIPNVAQTDKRADIAKNAALIQQMMQRRGIKTQLLEVPNGYPAVYGELLTPGAKHTVVFYSHYDGQPVIESQWASPPFEPILRPKVLIPAERMKAGERNFVMSLDGMPIPLPAESVDWRIYGRSTSDDKAPIIGMMAALDALRNAGIQPAINIKFFFEGEEEAGSDHLPAILAKYKDLLKSDLWIFCDGPVHQSGRKLLFFGARGVTGVNLTIYGPIRALHSGHYGNWVPNPAVELANLIAAMRDDNGRILIPGFYNAIRKLIPQEQKAIAEAPAMDDELRKSFEIGRVEGGGKKLNELILEPALNVRGIRSGAVGAQGTNSIPVDAQVSIDFRLVPNQTPELVRKQLEDFLKAKGYTVVHDEPTAEMRLKTPRLIRMQGEGGYDPSRAPMDSPEARAVITTVDSILAQPSVKMPTLGGSLPISHFTKVLGAPVVGLPIANADNNQHAANENIRIGNLWDSIEIYAALFAGLEANWK